MQMTRCSEVDSRSASQEIPRVLWNLIFPMCATFPFSLMLLGLITLIIFGAEYMKLLII
jgi:hypothetical protein